MSCRRRRIIYVDLLPGQIAVVRRRHRKKHHHER